MTMETVVLTFGVTFVLCNDIFIMCGTGNSAIQEKVGWQRLFTKTSQFLYGHNSLGMQYWRTESTGFLRLNRFKWRLASRLLCHDTLREIRLEERTRWIKRESDRKFVSWNWISYLLNCGLIQEPVESFYSFLLLLSAYFLLGILYYKWLY